MGTNTDPYQPAEGKFKLTRGIVEVLAERRNPFSILTKSPLVLRDLDLLRDAARVTEVTVDFSIGTLDPDVWSRSEPGTPHPRKRLDAVRRLNEEGIPSGVLMAPVTPGTLGPAGTDRSGGEGSGGRRRQVHHRFLPAPAGSAQGPLTCSGSSRSTPT